MGKVTQAEIEPWKHKAEHAVKNNRWVFINPQVLLALIDMIPVLRPIDEAHDTASRIAADCFMHMKLDLTDQQADAIHGAVQIAALNAISTLPTPEGE